MELASHVFIYIRVRRKLVHDHILIVRGSGLFICRLVFLLSRVPPFNLAKIRGSCLLFEHEFSHRVPLLDLPLVPLLVKLLHVLEVLGHL
jgi:hypothetical protein